MRTYNRKKEGEEEKGSKLTRRSAFVAFLLSQLGLPRGILQVHRHPSSHVRVGTYHLRQGRACSSCYHHRGSFLPPSPLAQPLLLRLSYLSARSDSLLPPFSPPPSSLPSPSKQATTSSLQPKPSPFTTKQPLPPSQLSETTSSSPLMEAPTISLLESSPTRSPKLPRGRRRTRNPVLRCSSSCLPGWRI